MIVRAMRFVALFSMLAWVQLIVFRMVLLLFPSVTLHASVFVWAAVFIIINKLSGSPIGTLIFRIDIKLRLSPKILPIMGEYALISLMVVLIVRAPDSLEMKHVEI